MGTVDMKTGNRISYEQFRNLLKLEASNDPRGRNLGEMLFRGNPFDEHVVNKNGDINDA